MASVTMIETRLIIKQVVKASSSPRIRGGGGAVRVFQTIPHNERNNNYCNNRNYIHDDNNNSIGNLGFNRDVHFLGSSSISSRYLTTQHNPDYDEYYLHMPPSQTYSHRTTENHFDDAIEVYSCDEGEVDDEVVLDIRTGSKTSENCFDSIQDDWQYDRMVALDEAQVDDEVFFGD